MVVVYLLLYQYKNKDELNTDLCIHNKYVIDNNIQYALYIIVKMTDVKKHFAQTKTSGNIWIQ